MTASIVERRARATDRQRLQLLERPERWLETPKVGTSRFAYRAARTTC
ncbi:hypothetical protein [Methylibium sp.]|nr:hypothetical protein [Methylibium sp.]MBA3591277.1 hypothetical protein [Methylibium sp.]